MLPSAASLRRAGLQYYSEDPASAALTNDQKVQLRQKVAEHLNVDQEHVLTEQDIQHLREFGWSDKAIAFAEQYRGLPIKWLFIDRQDPLWSTIPKATQIGWLLAVQVGKSVDQVFEQTDLDKLATKYGWGQGQINIWKPFVGKPFIAAATGLGGGLWDTLLNALLGFPSTPGTGIPNPLDVFGAVGKVLQFITDPANWLALVSIFVGVVLVAFGGSRWLTAR